MSLLDHLHPDLSIRTNPYSPPASEEDLGQLLSVFPNAPAEYVEMIRQYDGFEILSRNPDQDLYLDVLSALDALFSMTEWYPWMIQEMPGCFFFGRDGDKVFFISGDEQRPGVFKVECAGADWEFAKYVAPSLGALLRHGTDALDKD